MTEFFRNTLTPWQWAILAAVPPAIVALYFLKLKRQPLEVPSTYLWKKSIEDLHVNSLWQRLRQNLLLFLQLLLIGLAMFALLRPGWQGTKLTGDRFIFLVDTSASMSATDVTGSKTRLEEAKRLVGGLIDQMESGMTAMIISFADTPQVVQEFTDNRRLLRERLATIEPTVRGTELRGALELADGLANPNRVTFEEGGQEIEAIKPEAAELYIFSDGRFEEVKGFSLGHLKPVYVPIGTAEAKNLAITTFTTRRSEAKPEERQAFVQVANFTAEPQKTVVEIQLDGNFLDAKEVTVPAGEVSGVVFPLADAPAGALTARLKYEIDKKAQDVLKLDDLAFAALNDAKPAKVLVVSPGNAALETALATQRALRLGTVTTQPPSALKTEEYKKEADIGTYDLIIYDQCAPATMPRSNTVFIGRVPPTAAWHGGVEVSANKPAAEKTAVTSGKDGAITGETKDDNAAAPSVDENKVVNAPQIIDWDRAHPLLANVELGNVDVADTRVLDPPPGGTVLIDSTAGPIAAIAPRDAYQDAVLGFEIIGTDEDGSRSVNTNWPRRLSFPTFWLNALEYLGGGTEESQVSQVRPGRPIELRPGGNLPEVTVVTPAGKSVTVRRSAEDVFQFQDTNRLGVYDVKRGDKVLERFSVNLADRRESDVHLRTRQSEEANTVHPADIRIGHVDVAASVDQAPARHEIWKLVLMGALFVLLFEWYIYNRRVYL